MLLFEDDGNAPVLFIDNWHGFVAVGTFDINKIVEKTDAVVVYQQVKLFFAGRAGSEVASQKQLYIRPEGIVLLP